jgi:hypothetical protein
MGDDGWAELLPPDWEVLDTDDPLARTFAQGNERVFPPFDVRDWWEHPGEQGPTTPSGLTGVPRQLIVTTERVLVVADGTVERTVAIASIGGSRTMKSSEWPIDKADRAVVVHSGRAQGSVWGCWSTSKDEAGRLMGIIFWFANGGRSPFG